MSAAIPPACGRWPAGRPLAAAAVVVMLAGCATHAPQAPLPPTPIDRLGSTGKAPIDCSVALFGDSILYGAHNGMQRLAEPPAAVLQKARPRYRIADRSVPGASAHVWRTRFLSRRPVSRIVVLQYGMNDAGHGYPYEPALRAMVSHVRAHGKTPVITGISQVVGGMPQRDEYDAVARRIAVDTGTLFADWGAVRFDPADMADGVHPGPAYSVRLVRQLVAALDRIAPECAPAPTAAGPRQASAVAA